MSPRPVRNASRKGSVLVIAVCFGAIIGIALVSCLSLVSSQNQAVVRSQSWNLCIPVVEAGIEEAMAHLNNRNEKSYAVNDWKQSGNEYSRSRPLGKDFYDVNIDLTAPLAPIIVCTGYVRAPFSFVNHELVAAANVDLGGVLYLSRAVKATAVRRPRFPTGMIARQRIDMNGNTITTDSFDSKDPNHSTTNGLYDPAKAKDHGDVSTTAGGTNIINVGNANIKGKLRTAPGGTSVVGAMGTVGSLAWHAAGKTGIEPGWSSDDLNVAFDDVKRPFTGGAMVPSSGTITGTVVKYLLTGGEYEIASLSIGSKEKMVVSGHSVLLVNGDVKTLGGIEILPGGSLELYVAGAKADIGGAGINNSGQAGNFIYYGLPSNTSLTLSSNGDFTGAIYAPAAELKLSGGGSTTLHFTGACVVKSIVVNGIYQFHYDEALDHSGPPGNFVIVSWVELDRAP
jgi:hypothetical protein